MKQVGLTGLLLFGSLSVFAQARLQVIHNSADAAAAVVDVRVDGTFPDASYDNLGFREATPFISVPAGTYTVTINGQNSTDASAAVFTKNLTLADGGTYIVMASGIVSATGYSPSATEAPFDLFVQTNAREVALNASENDVLVFHGATDAPEVRVTNVTNPLATADLVPGFTFNDFAGYLSLPNADYNLQIRTMDRTTVAEYEAPLQTLNAAGAAVTVMASGFLNPANNSGGAAFGLYAVLADGTVIPLPAVATPTTARLQVVHNCAATDAASVGVWVNDAVELIPQFDFRTATPFIDVPAGVDLSIDITAPNAMDASAPLYTQTINLTGGQKYVAVASGTIGSGTYTPATPFSLVAFSGARESAETAGNVSVGVFHGATDAPVVDVNEVGIPAGIIVDDIAYGENQGYLDLAPLSYILQIEAGGNAVEAFDADLSGLANNALVVFASGFLSPSTNNNGAGFGLWAATPAGGNLINLPVSAVASLDEAAISNGLIYPNPAQDVISSTVKGERYAITDMQGRVLQEGQMEDSISVATLSHGQYLFVVDGTTSIRFNK